MAIFSSLKTRSAGSIDLTLGQSAESVKYWDLRTWAPRISRALTVRIRFRELSEPIQAGFIDFDRVVAGLDRQGGLEPLV